MKKIKRVSFICVLLALTLACTVLSAAALNYGDLDKDGKIQAKEARIVLRHSAKIELITDQEILKLADATRDGKVNASDARAILRIAAKMDQPIPVETDPPVTDPPATNPPATKPPVTNPPATDPPITEPPIQFVPDDSNPGSVDIGDLN